MDQSHLAEPGPRPITRLAGGRIAARLAAAFDRLTRERRRVSGLRNLERLTDAEAGALMGRNEKAIRSLSPHAGA